MRAVRVPRVAACRRSGFSFLLVRSDRAGAAMTYPPQVAALVKAVQEAVDRGVVQHRDECDTFDLMIHGKPCNCGKGKLLSALAALTGEPTPEQVEELAREMFEIASAAGDWRSDDDAMTPFTWVLVSPAHRWPWLCVARELLGAGVKTRGVRRGCEYRNKQGG